MAKKYTFVLGMIVLGIACQGCSTAYNMSRTMIVEPSKFCWDKEIVCSKMRFHQQALATWKDYQTNHPDHSEHFGEGFLAGFEDHLFYGGNCEPPALPPRKYWGSKYQSPQGHQAIQDWFAGFRLGAGMARESGLRQQVVLPSSLANPNHEPDMRFNTTPPREIIPEKLPVPTPVEPVSFKPSGKTPSDLAPTSQISPGPFSPGNVTNQTTPVMDFSKETTILADSPTPRPSTLNWRKSQNNTPPALPPDSTPSGREVSALDSLSNQETQGEIIGHTPSGNDPEIISEELPGTCKSP